MHVAYLINRYPAASHSFVRREIEAVEAQGISVTRFSVRQAQLSQLPDARDQAELAKTITLLEFSIISLVSTGLARLIASPLLGLRGLRTAFVKSEWRPSEVLRRLAYFAEAAMLAKLIKRARIEHIHAHFGTNSATVARVAGLLAGVPYSFTVHGPDEFDAPDRLDLAGKIKDCAFCVAISSFGRSQLMRWSAFSDWHKLQIVRCGVDSNFLQGPTLSEPPSKPRLCSIARLSPQKGIPLLLEAAAELKRRGRTFHLALVGDGELRSVIEGLISDLDLNGFVTLEGLADSATVISNIQQSRVMVLPSFAEGLPVVIMEALALGRPVIVSTIAGTPELVGPDCGWLVPAGSVDKLVEAMDAALEASTAKLASMGKNGRERVEMLHNADLNGRDLAALFVKARQA